MKVKEQISREDFMTFFRDDEKLNQLSTDDRIEIFRTILSGGSDLMVELLNDILRDYSVDNIEVIEIKNGKK